MVALCCDGAYAGVLCVFSVCSVRFPACVVCSLEPRTSLRSVCVLRTRGAENVSNGRRRTPPLVGGGDYRMVVLGDNDIVSHSVFHKGYLGD